MPRTLKTLCMIGAAATLLGCSGSESTAFPEDGRQQNNPIGNQNLDQLSGRALDGYLQGAFVWLDLNENGQWEEGEPAAETGAGGRFSLDVSSLQREPSVGADLDPRHYPLMLLAIPGKTIDEDHGQTVERGFMLMAPPGLRVITPFTTLIEFDRRINTFSGADLSETVTESTRRVKERLGTDVSGFSLQVDYLQGNNARAAAYGQAITAFLEYQTQDTWSEALAAGSRQVFDNDLINILGGTTLAQVPDLVAQTTALLDAEGVENFDVSKLALTRFDLDNQDPYVIQTQRLYMDREFTKNSDPETMLAAPVNLVGYGQNENFSAELRYFYDAAGRLVRLDVKGWTDPDLEQLRQLIQVRGQVSRLETQLSPGLMVRYSRADEIDDSIDERYRFDWAAGRIEWDTNNPEYGAAVVELDDIPEQVITWESVDDRVMAIERATGNGSFLQRLEIDYAGASGLAPARYRFVGTEGSVAQTWVWNTAPECDVIDVYPGSDTSGEPAISHYHSYAPATEETGRRLLNLTRTVDYAAVPEPVSVEWVSGYFDGFLTTGSLDPRQPNLLRERVLKYLKNPPNSCSEDSRSSPGSALAVSRFDYQRLSARVAEQGAIE